MEEEIEEETSQVPKIRGRHIKKRALKNKALAVSFDEKDLKDYVTGFHKRKKKRRKEAEKQQEEAERRKRLELRKKRRLERQLALYGGVLPTTESKPDETQEYPEEDEEREAAAPLTGTTLYDNGDMQVTVTTAEISREEEDFPKEKIPVIPRSLGTDEKHKIPVSKRKPFKKVAKHKSRSRPQSKRDKKKGKKKNKKKR